MAAKLAGKDVNLRDLLRPEYIGSRKGSSIAELQKAAADLGLQCSALGNLTGRSLRKSPYPLILHVRSKPNAEDVDHFVLCLGVQGNGAIIYDAPRSPKVVPLYELAEQWDGIALIVSAQSTDLNWIAAYPPQLLFEVTMAGAVVCVAHVLQRRWNATLLGKRRHWMMKPIGEAIGIIGMSTLCGTVCNVAADDGVLAYADSTLFVDQRHASNFTPTLTVSEMQAAVHRGCVVIDARYPADYGAGHIAGAINIPVGTDVETRRRILADVPREASIVVYCQSAGCSFADRILGQMMTDGYTKLSIFRGGWNDWTAITNTQHQAQVESR